MIPTITNEFLNHLITNATGYNLVAILINKPTLGLTNSPTNDQLNLRRQLTTTEAVAQEISSTGYKRHVVQLLSEDIVVTSQQFSITVTSSFTAPSTNALGPFTHICYIRGANLVGATNLNGNNRGDTTGIVYKVEPVINAPLSIQANSTFNHSTDITFSV